jgi:phage shock protein A
MFNYKEKVKELRKQVADYENKIEDLKSKESVLIKKHKN